MDVTFVWKLSKLTRIGSSRLRGDDDFADRLNHQFTIVLLLIFTFISGVRQYIGKPIQCWVPQMYTRAWEEYAENYCWVANTYFAPVANRIPLPSSAYREQHKLAYYQWTPIILCTHAVLFLTPRLVWRQLMNNSGFNVMRIMQMANDINVVIPESLSRNVRFMARYMEGCIYRQRDYRRGVAMRLKQCFANCTCACCGKRYGNFLVCLYFFIKLLYLLNVFGLLLYLEHLLQVPNQPPGIGLYVAKNLIRGIQWSESKNFPRVTFCDLQTKRLGENLHYTLQCVLPLNMFLEKIYMILWFWYVIVGLVTLSSFVGWFFRIAFTRRRLSFVRKYLKIMNVLKDTDKTTSRKFVENYLRIDGVFILRVISINYGDIIAGDLACELWSIYRHKRLQELEDTKLEAEYRQIAYAGMNSNNGNNNNNNNNNNNGDDNIV